MVFIALIVVVPGQLVSSFPASANTPIDYPEATPQNEIDISIESGKSVFLYFYLDTCSYCQKEKPIIEELESEYGEEFTFISIAGNENRELVQQFEVSAYPSMFLISGIDESGNYIYEPFIGFTTRETLQASLEYYLEQNTFLDNSVSELAGLEDTGVSNNTCVSEGPGEVADSGCSVKNQVPEATAEKLSRDASLSTLDVTINTELENGKPVFLFIYADWCGYCPFFFSVTDKLFVDGRKCFYRDVAKVIRPEIKVQLVYKI